MKFYSHLPVIKQNPSKPFKTHPKSVPSPTSFSAGAVSAAASSASSQTCLKTSAHFGTVSPSSLQPSSNSSHSWRGSSETSAANLDPIVPKYVCFKDSALTPPHQAAKVTAAVKALSDALAKASSERGSTICRSSSLSCQPLWWPESSHVRHFSSMTCMTFVRSTHVNVASRTTPLWATQTCGRGRFWISSRFGVWSGWLPQGFWLQTGC